PEKLNANRSDTHSDNRVNKQIILRKRLYIKRSANTNDAIIGHAIARFNETGISLTCFNAITTHRIPLLEGTRVLQPVNQARRGVPNDFPPLGCLRHGQLERTRSICRISSRQEFISIAHGIAVSVNPRGGPECRITTKGSFLPVIRQSIKIKIGTP